MLRNIEVRVAEPSEAERLYAMALDVAEAEPSTLEEVHTLLNRAREAGSFEAAYALGNWYGHGVHVERDPAMAYDLYLEAAKGNVPEALFNLGVSHENGWGVPVDKAEAYRSYLRAALFGDLDATYEVFRCHQDGVGVSADHDVARIWRDMYKARGGNFTAKDSER